MNPSTTGVATLTPGFPKPQVTIAQIDNGFLLSWYDNHDYKTHQVHVENLGIAKDNLETIFDSK